MIIKYNSLKSNRLNSIVGTALFGVGALVAFFNNDIILICLSLLIFLISFIASYIYFYKNPFDVLDVKIDTQKRIISYKATSNKRQEYKNEIISFNQIKCVNVKLATGKSGSDSIEFRNDNDLSFSIPIHHNEIKELEKFFEINYIMSGDLKTNLSRETKIKKLYKSGLLGSMFSWKGYLFLLLVFILFMLNLFIIIPLAKYLFNIGASNNIISFSVVIELILFMYLMTILWKFFR